jgi:glycerate kinase
MTVLIAPDKFKGSLEAPAVCRAIEEALTESGLKIEVRSVPMADGGEGTCDMLTRVSNGRIVSVPVLDPLFRDIEASYGLSGDNKTAFIEMAAASGLQRLNSSERNPLETTTYGTGQLITDALNRGVTNIIMGIGGSATNDAGMGMAEALGVQFLSREGKKLRPVGKDLIYLHRIDTTHLHPRLKEASFAALCDVSNPFYGNNGAAYVFAPQKGADSEAVKLLDDGLRNFATVVRRQFDMDVNFPGAGAGGGLSGGAKVFFNIQFQPGVEFLIQYAGLEKKVEASDAVITGEGKVDVQTLSGKVVKGIASLALKYQKPLYIVAGKNELDQKEAAGLGAQKIITLQNANISDQDAMGNAYNLLKQRVKEDLLPFFYGI